MNEMASIFSTWNLQYLTCQAAKVQPLRALISYWRFSALIRFRRARVGSPPFGFRFLCVHKCMSAADPYTVHSLISCIFKALLSFVLSLSCHGSGRQSPRKPGFDPSPCGTWGGGSVQWGRVYLSLFRLRVWITIPPVLHVHSSVTRFWPNKPIRGCSAKRTILTPTQEFKQKFHLRVSLVSCLFPSYFPTNTLIYLSSSLQHLNGHSSISTSKITPCSSFLS